MEIINRYMWTLACLSSLWHWSVREIRKKKMEKHKFTMELPPSLAGTCAAQKQYDLAEKPCLLHSGVNYKKKTTTFFVYDMIDKIEYETIIAGNFRFQSTEVKDPPHFAFFENFGIKYLDNLTFKAYSVFKI